MNISQYEHIPQHMYERFQNQSDSFLQRANEYFKSYDNVYKYTKLLREAEKTMKQKRKEYYAACNHDFEMLPREYQTPREYVCRICGEEIC